jgi:manganese-transporting P-type ATPase
MCCQEAIETVEQDTFLDLELHGKLHILYGGTKVVQHTPPSKTAAGLKGIKYKNVQSCAKA